MEILDDRLLGEIKGRLRFGASSIEDRINKTPRPEPRPWTWPNHTLDDLAENFGLRGFELKDLQDAAWRELPSNKILQAAYARYLMAAKLVCVDALVKSRDREQRIAEDRANRENNYQRKLRDWEHRSDQLTRNWTETRQRIRTIWCDLCQALAGHLERDASVASLSFRDGTLISELTHRGLMRVRGSRVRDVNWDAILDLDIQDINDIISALPPREE